MVGSGRAAATGRARRGNGQRRADRARTPALHRHGSPPLSCCGTTGTTGNPLPKRARYSMLAVWDWPAAWRQEEAGPRPGAGRRG